MTSQNQESAAYKPLKCVNRTVARWNTMYWKGSIEH